MQASRGPLSTSLAAYRSLIQRSNGTPFINFNISKRTLITASTPQRPRRRVVWFNKQAFTKVSAVALGIGSLMFGCYQYKRYEESPMRAFERGNLATNTGKQEVSRVNRASDATKLISLLIDPDGHYVVVSGEQGCGKTSLVKQVCPSLGCVYISLPVTTEKSIGAVLAAPFDKKVPPNASLGEAFALIERGAIDFKARTKLVPFVILDDIDTLAATCPRHLETLQRQADKWAKDKVVKVVFVANDAVAHQMKDNSIKWRHYPYHECHVGDIPTQSAVQYLVDKYLSEDLSTQVVHKLTGGSLPLLRILHVHDGVTYEEIQQQILTEITFNDSKAKSLAKKLSEELLNSPTRTVDYQQFMASTGCDQGSLYKFMSINVFRLANGALSFHSVGMQSLLEELLRTAAWED